MAAATVSSSAIDLQSQATLPIRLGASILESPSEASRFMGVRYNHRPSLQQSDKVQASVSEDGEVGLSRLSLQCEKGKYVYTGRHAQEEDCYVLLCRGTGKDKELVLERMHSSHAVNLTKTPAEDNATTLAARHPHLPVEALELGEKDLFGDDDEEAPADDSNPFDYRHFLKAELEKSVEAIPPLDATRSVAGTPLLQHQRPGSTPLRKTTKAAKPPTKAQPLKKRKPAAAAKPNPKRVKAGEEPSGPSPAAEKSKPKVDIPKVHLDRKASLRRSSIEDSGELILEGETPVTAKPPRHNAMSLALSGQLGGGPISLMSAANSPGNGLTPETHEAEEVPETYEFELGDSSPEHGDDNGDLVLDEEEDVVDADADGEDDDDEDVESMELPSPAQGRSRPSVSAAAGPAGGDDEDDDDLEKQMALAFAEGEGSEESEEE